MVAFFYRIPHTRVCVYGDVMRFDESADGRMRLVLTLIFIRHLYPQSSCIIN